MQPIQPEILPNNNVDEPIQQAIPIVVVPCEEILPNKNVDEPIQQREPIQQEIVPNNDLDQDGNNKDVYRQSPEDMVENLDQDGNNKDVYRQSPEDMVENLKRKRDETEIYLSNELKRARDQAQQLLNNVFDSLQNNLDAGSSELTSYQIKTEKCLTKLQSQQACLERMDQLSASFQTRDSF